MKVSLDINCRSLNKYEEELCGDTVEVIKTEDASIVIMSDGMGSGVKANILATLTTKILGTMLKNGETIEDCVETIAMTLPICQTRQVAYSTFVILKIYKDNWAYLVEYDTPPCVYIRDGKKIELPYTIREIAGKKIREYAHFQVEDNDCFVMMSDGVTHAGVGGNYSFGWGWTNASSFIERTWQSGITSTARLAAAIVEECNNIYHHRPGDDTTIIVGRITRRKELNIFTGPPTSRDDDEELIRQFMEAPGRHVICGGTSATIASRVLKRRLKPSLIYTDPDIPPTATLEGMDLVTEGVLTLNRVVALLQSYNNGEQDDKLFTALDQENGASELARMLIEECTDIHLFVGEAMNPAHQAAGLPFDLSIRMRLVDRMISESQKMGKTVTVQYY